MAGSKLMPKAAGYYESDRSDFLDWVDGSYSRILDIGCGAGANADWYFEQSSLSRVDPRGRRTPISEVDDTFGIIPPQPRSDARVDLVSKAR